MNDLRGDLLTLGEWQGSLKDVVENLEFLEKQLLYSAHAAEEELKAQFSQLEQELLSALKQRRNTLLSEVSAARAKAMKPLSDCKKQIEVEIAAADLAHAEGTQLARSDGDSGTASPEEMRMFCRRISDFERFTAVLPFLIREKEIVKDLWGD